MQDRALLEGARQRPCQRHFQAIKNPGHPERDDDQGMEWGPRQAFQARRYVAFDYSFDAN
jgi:hypothetical protein